VHQYLHSASQQIEAIISYMIHHRKRRSTDSIISCDFCDYFTFCDIFLLPITIRIRMNKVPWMAGCSSTFRISYISVMRGSVAGWGVPCPSHLISSDLRKFDGQIRVDLHLLVVPYERLTFPSFVGSCCCCSCLFIHFLFTSPVLLSKFSFSITFVAGF